MTIDPAHQLRQHGVQVTAQRLAVLRALSGRPHCTAAHCTAAHCTAAHCTAAHCTADRAAADVRAQIRAISRQAVYDALAILTEKGIIRRIPRGGSPAIYDNRGGDNHHHAICRGCGKAVDVDCAVGKTPCLTPSDNSGYQIDAAEVIYWGTCPECLAAT